MKKKENKNNLWLLLLCGAVVGALNGFFGGGGGMICVPYMQNILKIETKKAHATAVFVMFCLSLVSSFVYAFSQTYNFVDVAVVSVFASIGSLVGALCLKKFKSIVIEFIFLGLLLFAAIKMVV